MSAAPFSCGPGEAVPVVVPLVLFGITCGVAVATWSAMTAFVVRSINRSALAVDRPTRRGIDLELHYDEFDLDVPIVDYLDGIDFREFVSDEDLECADEFLSRLSSDCPDALTKLADVARSCGFSHDDDPAETLRTVKYVLIVRLLAHAASWPEGLSSPTLRAWLSSGFECVKARFPTASAVDLPTTGDLFDVLYRVSLHHLVAFESGDWEEASPAVPSSVLQGDEVLEKGLRRRGWGLR